MDYALGEQEVMLRYRRSHGNKSKANQIKSDLQVWHVANLTLYSFDLRNWGQMNEVLNMVMKTMDDGESPRKAGLYHQLP